MKQVQCDTGGRPFANDDLVTIQQELTDAVQAQFLGKGPFILSGCGVSGSGPAYNVAAGIVCLDGQLLRFPGAGAVTLPAQFQAGTAVLTDPRPYQTGGTKSCMREVPAELVAADATYTLGEFLPLGPWGGKTWDHVVRASVRYLGEIQPLGLAGYVPTDYDATGLGKPGTPAWGWALNNGNSNTDDLERKTIFGASAVNGDYAPGHVGGHETVSLQQANLPINPTGAPDVATFVGGGQGKNLVADGNNGWTGRQPQAGIGLGFDIRPPYMALPIRQWVGY